MTVSIAIEASLGGHDRYKQGADGVWTLHHRDDFVWPVNYGFVPGTRSADGEALDVVVVAATPITPTITTRGRLIGVLLRSDGDHKLIAALPGDPHYGDLVDVAALATEYRALIEVFCSQQAPTIGWAGPVEAARLLAEARLPQAPEQR